MQTDLKCALTLSPNLFSLARANASYSASMVMVASATYTPLSNLELESTN
jgi:hypothetical protein